MGRAKQLTMEEKTRIMCWGAEGVTPKDIAHRLGRNAATIRKHLAVLRDLPPNATPPPPKPRSGRPCSTSTRQDTRLINYVQRYPLKTARQLQKEVPGWRQVAVRTIQKRLQRKLGLSSLRAAKKPNSY